MPSPRPVTVGVDPALLEWREEILYTLRTLLRTAGLPYHFYPAGDDPQRKFDLYYGFPQEENSASVIIPACGLSYTETRQLEPDRLYNSNELPYLSFAENEGFATQFQNGTYQLEDDIIFASYWLLIGARETSYARGRKDDLRLEDGFFLENSLPALPLVSRYGDWLRKHFRKLGFQPLDFPWRRWEGETAFVLSHDVDYPQIIRSIEVLRLLGQRGVKGLRSAYSVLLGKNHFWKFTEWVNLAAEYSAAPTFYFMARQGSLLQYARGNPDSFYDISSQEFRRLFDLLKDSGCEIGMHASYHAYRQPDQIRIEKERLETITGAPVAGNRHHYWHLDPAAPHETLALAEQAGLLYDSSLAFEYYPGFRRGICHPFRPFHPGERRELDLVELPPAWMDDHFDRRLSVNRIDSPEAYAHGLVESARSTGGVIVLDYHVRGMNQDIFPRYGRWLRQFLDERVDGTEPFYTAQALAEMYLEYENRLETNSFSEL